MMNWIIKLSPQCVDAPEILVLSAHGARLSINEDVLELSLLEDGDILSADAIDHPLLRGSEIRRRGDVIEIDAMLFPISLDQTDAAACFPEPIIATQDGLIPLPSQISSISESVVETKENLREN